MSEARQLVLSHQEVVEALIKQHGIHEGLWGVYVQFGIGGANINTDSEHPEMLPAAIVPIVKMGIQRFDEANPLTVDAAVVNPARPRRRAKSKAAK